MVLREQALDPHTPYLLLVQQAALSPQSGDKQKKHCGHILKQYIFKTLGQHCANVFFCLSPNIFSEWHIVPLL